MRAPTVLATFSLIASLLRRVHANGQTCVDIADILNKRTIGSSSNLNATECFRVRFNLAPTASAYEAHRASLIANGINATGFTHSEISTATVDGYNAYYKSQGAEVGAFGTLTDVSLPYLDPSNYRLNFHSNKAVVYFKNASQANAIDNSAPLASWTGMWTIDYYSFPSDRTDPAKTPYSTVQFGYVFGNKLVISGGSSLINQHWSVSGISGVRSPITLANHDKLPYTLHGWQAPGQTNLMNCKYVKAWFKVLKCCTAA